MTWAEELAKKWSMKPAKGGAERAERTLGAIKEALEKAAEVVDAAPWRSSANEALDIAVNAIRKLYEP